MNDNPSFLLFVIFGTLLITLFAFFMIIYIVIQKRKHYSYHLEKLEINNRFQQELLQSRLEVQERAFQHFSEEIHDNVGQILSLTKLHLHQLTQYCREEQSERLINKSTELVSKAINDLRSISHTLNSSFIAKAGLVESLEKETGHINSSRSITAGLRVAGGYYSLGEEKELLIFRIVQEAMANAIRHAAPQSILIGMDYQPDKLNITVTDDGIGFVPGDREKKDGLGLNNMHVRAQLLQGDLAIQSAPGTGTTINLIINRNEQ